MENIDISPLLGLMSQDHIVKNFKGKPEEV